MRIHKDKVPVRIDVPGATARQQTNFGDVSNDDTLGAEHFSFGAVTDIVMFSPQKEHGEVIEHIRGKVGA